MLHSFLETRSSKLDFFSFLTHRTAFSTLLSRQRKRGGEREQKRARGREGEQERERAREQERERARERENSWKRCNMARERTRGRRRALLHGERAQEAAGNLCARTAWRDTYNHSPLTKQYFFLYLGTWVSGGPFPSTQVGQWAPTYV